MVEEGLAVGVVAALYRYPVKSMCGEAIDEGRLWWHGFDGDRRYAFEHPSCYSVPVPTWASVGGISARTRSSVAGSSGKR